MNRDMELVRKMVLAIEDDPRGWAPDINLDGVGMGGGATGIAPHYHGQGGHVATLSVPDHEPVAKGTLRGLIRSAGLTVDAFVSALR